MAKAKKGQTSAHRAASKGHVDVMKILLSNGALVNDVDCKDQTALHRAAYFGHVATVNCLANHKAFINVLDKNLRTPLHAASSAGQTHILAILLERKGDTKLRDRDGRTTLDEAAVCGKTEIVKLCLPYYKDRPGEDIGLHQAASKGHSEVIEVLSRARAQLDWKNKEGFTPLHNAVCHNQYVSVRRLLQLQASPDVRAGKQRGKAWTALHWAAAHGRGVCVGILLQYGASPDLEDNNRMRPRDLVQGHAEVTSLFDRYAQRGTTFQF